MSVARGDSYPIANHRMTGNHLIEPSPKHQVKIALA